MYLTFNGISCLYLVIHFQLSGFICNLSYQFKADDLVKFYFYIFISK